MPPEPVEVTWEVADDDGMRRRSCGTGARPRPPPTGAHACTSRSRASSRPLVLVPVPGRRRDEPDRPHARRCPRSGADVNRLRFAFASCQHYETGYFTAYRHMAAEDLDLVFHLGDYIYEGPGRDGRVAQAPWPELDDAGALPQPPRPVPADPDLQAAHAAFPWLVTWDDHEVDNNYAGATFRRTTIRATRSSPAARRPTRPTTSTCRSGGARSRRARRCGSTGSSPTGRSRRSSCSTRGSTAPISRAATRRSRPAPAPRDPDATLLGAAQEKWLLDGARPVASGAGTCCRSR